MRFKVKLHPRSSKNSVLKEDDGSLNVYLTARPVENKANQALVELLSKDFKVSKSRIKIISGFKSRNKVVEIVDPPQRLAGQIRPNNLRSLCSVSCGLI